MRNNAPSANYHSVVQSHLWRQGQCDGLSAFDFGATGVGLSSSQGHCVICSWARHFTLTVPFSSQVW